MRCAVTMLQTAVSFYTQAPLESQVLHFSSSAKFPQVDEDSLIEAESKMDTCPCSM